MKHESGFDPSIQNPYTKATGLIQFMPATAIGLKTTVDALRKLNGIKQLEYVEKYYKPVIGRAKTIGDLYMWTFIPAALGKPESFKLGIKGATTKIFGLSQNSLYTQNKLFDADNKGYYTVGDVHKRINGYPA
jgi:hypothetical protein